jgi:dihydroxyacetone kinase-like predicted kinase
MPISYLNGPRFYHAFVAGGEAVIKKQSYLNKINVFPVADADTGTNLATTMRTIVQAAEVAPSLKTTLETIADAALSGARGNSGIIFAQYFYGLSRELPARAEVSEYYESGGRYHAYGDPRVGRSSASHQQQAVRLCACL